jgi:hypothetical protein
MFYLFFKKNYLWFFFLIALLNFLYAINLYQYIYDGHHHGYMITNAIDLINGRLPYKEIFIQYGIFTTLIHVFALKIFSQNLIAINIITCLLYALTILLISLIVIKKTNIIYGLLSLLIIFFNHPIPWLPWSNYYAFFFIILGFFLLLNLEKSYIFFSGIFFSLACLSRETYFSVISVIIFLITVYLIYQKKNKLIFSLILGFIIPYSIFFFYLFYNNIFYDWISYLQLPKLYLSKYNIKIYQAILNGSFYIFFKTWIEILYKPQNIIISLIVVINSLYFFNHFFFKKKKLDFYLLLISIATLTLTVIAISDEIFRLYTSLIIGIIPALNFIFNIKNKENKIIILFLLIFISLYSFYFFPKGNRSQFEKLNKVNLIENNNLRYFKYQKWSENDWEVLNQIDNITKTVKKKCKIEYGLNYTFDGFYYLILDLKMLQLAPAVTEDENNIFNFFETRFKKNILSNIEKNNLILITNGHFKERYDNKNYKTFTLYKDKSNIYRDVVYISFPQKCWNE